MLGSQVINIKKLIGATLVTYENDELKIAGKNERVCEVKCANGGVNIINTKPFSFRLF